MSRTRIALGDALDALIDHRGKTPKKLGGDWAASGHRVVSAINIKDSRVDQNDHHYVTDEMYARWMKEPLKAGDVLLTSEAPTGEVAYLGHDTDWCIGQRLFGLRGKAGVLDGRYLFYLLRGGDVRHQLMARSTGTTVAGIRQSELVKVELDLPPIDEQKAIAATLGALDDKVESSRRLIQLLRELSIALLQRAASSGGVVVLGEVADVRKGLSYKGSGLADEGVPMVNMGSAANFGWLKRSGFKHYQGEYQPRHVARAGSLIVTAVEQTWRNEIIAWPLLVPYDVGDVLFTHHMLLVDFRPGFEWLRLPLWAQLYSNDVRARLEGMIYGTTVATLPHTALSSLSFPAPTKEAPEIDAAEGMLQRVWAAERESLKLAALRDALLPELLAGRIGVAPAEPAEVAR